MRLTAFIIVSEDWDIRFHNYLTIALKGDYELDDLMWCLEMATLYYTYRVNTDDTPEKWFRHVIYTHNQPTHDSIQCFELFETTYQEIKCFLKMYGSSITGVDIVYSEGKLVGVEIAYLE